MDKNSSSRPLPPEVVVDGRGLAWREVEAVVDSDDDIWEDKLLLVLGAVAKEVFFFCRTLAMVASVVSGECACDEYNMVFCLDNRRRVFKSTSYDAVVRR